MSKKQGINIVGQRFGHLVAIRQTNEKGSNGAYKWLFKCDCGNDLIVYKSKVIEGSTITCGSINCPYHNNIYNSQDITGQRFGHLVVIKKVEEQAANGSYKWLCRCDCGREVTKTKSNIRNGKSKSCGHVQCNMK